MPFTPEYKELLSKVNARDLCCTQEEARMVSGLLKDLEASLMLMEARGLKPRLIRTAVIALILQSCYRGERYYLPNANLEIWVAELHAMNELGTFGTL